MAQIIEMEEKRRSLSAKKAFRRWNRLFSQTYDETTRPQDLTNKTLFALIQPGERTAGLLYEFVTEIKGWGHETHFDSLAGHQKMQVMDIGLFLLDQLRFECMKRIGWIESYPTLHVPLVEVVERFSERFASERHQTPFLSPAHPRYEEYQKTFEGDRGAFLRRLIPEAIHEFGEMSEE